MGRGVDHPHIVSATDLRSLNKRPKPYVPTISEYCTFVVIYIVKLRFFVPIETNQLL